MMMKSIVIALALLTNAVSGSEDWSWEGDTGPEHWVDLGYEECGGNSQSPIEISAKAEGHFGLTSKYHPLSKYMNPARANYAVTQAHGGPKFSCRTENTCGDLTWKGVTYYLNSIHLHTPAEHTINMGTFGMVAHMVHLSASGKYAVVAINFEGSASANVTGSTDASKFLRDLYTYRNEEVAKTVKLDFGNFIEEGSGFYKYDGSFTTPPCTEGVKWFIQAKPVQITPKQINRMWKQFGEYPGVARNPQPLKGRTIEYYVDN